MFGLNKGLMVFSIYAIIQRDLRIECMLFIMKIINFFTCCSKIKSSKILNKIESDLAKAYPFKFKPHGAKRNSRTKSFDSTTNDLNNEYLQLNM
jgi:hypothetical protein